MRPTPRIDMWLRGDEENIDDLLEEARKIEREADELREALQLYLNAGHKQARKEASIVAKAALKNTEPKE